MRLHKILFLLLTLLTSYSFAGWTGGTSEPESTRKIGGKIFYEITTPEELAWFAEQVNGGSTAINAVLDNDIIFGDTMTSYTAHPWTPIGKDTTHTFKGVLDGAGYSIYGVYTQKDSTYGGLVGVLAKEGIVRNVNIKKDSINANDCAGGLVAYNYGTITNCTNSGSVSGTFESGGIAGINAGTVSNCTNNSSISSYSHYSGGITGINSGTISGCTNSGSISSRYHSGGIAGGNNKGTISNCTNSGNVSSNSSGGGIAGHNAGTVSNCTNSGRVSSSYNYCSGGIAGVNDGDVQNSYSVADSVSGIRTSGGVVGINSSIVVNSYYDADRLPGVSAIDSSYGGTAIDVDGLPTAQMQTVEFAWLLNTANGKTENSGAWSRDGGYPIFADVQNKAIYKVVFDDEGVPTNRYSNNKGVVQFPEAPEPASGYVFVAWLDTDGNIFSEKSTLSSDKKATPYYALESDSLYIVDFMDTEGNLWASRPTNVAGGLDSVPEPPAPDSGFYFIGWFDSLDSRVEPTTVFTGNTTLSAKYSKLTIVFLNADGDTLQNSVAKYGSIPKYMGKTPTKASTTEYDYTFYGWNPNLATATEPATYTAVFDSSLKTFMVTFRNGFTTLQSTKVGYGATPAYNGNTPTKPSSTQYDYTFKGWSPSIVPVTGNAIYTAVFDSTAISQGSSSSVAQSSSSAIASSSSAMQSSSSMIASSSSVSSSSFGIMSSSSAVVQSSSSAVQSSSSVIASSSSEAPSSSSGVSNSSSSATDAFRFSAHPRFNLHVQNRTLQIQNARIGSAFAVLDLQGRVLRRGVVNSPEFSMELQNAGAYIVRIDSQVQKIRVK